MTARDEFPNVFSIDSPATVAGGKMPNRGRKRRKFYRKLAAQHSRWAALSAIHARRHRMELAEYARTDKLPFWAMDADQIQLCVTFWEKMAALGKVLARKHENPK